MLMITEWHTYTSIYNYQEAWCSLTLSLIIDCIIGELQRIQPQGTCMYKSKYEFIDSYMYILRYIDEFWHRISATSPQSRFGHMPQQGVTE